MRPSGHLRRWSRVTDRPTQLSIPLMEMFLMYDMYPEWGPGRHRDDNDDAQQSVQVGLDLRDNGGQRPDDN